MPFVFAAAADHLPVRPAKRRKLVMARDAVGSSHDEDDFVYETGDDTKMARDGHADPRPTRNDGAPLQTSDREELIQCIKRGHRPTWVPKPGLEALCAQANAEQRPVMSAAAAAPPSAVVDVRPVPVSRPEVASGPRSIQSSHPVAISALEQSLSALHTGDFHERPRWPSMTTARAAGTIADDRYDLPYGSSPPPFWGLGSHDGAPSVAHSLASTFSPSEVLRRSRAPSLGSSLSSSFVMRVPTSPLVNAMNNPSLDFSARDRTPSASTSSRSARRRTMPPHAFGSLHAASNDAAAADFPRTPHPHRDDMDPGHQPRRSLSSFTYQPALSAQGPFMSRSRRPSLASDVSPRQRASMVGSFEESILRGRMSTPPSKPLDFVAQIGVVGKGNCPANLRCPAHITVPFPAVFYNYPSAHPSRSISDDNPSPYVGIIDLEHHLTPPEPPVRRVSRQESPAATTTDTATTVTSLSPAPGHRTGAEPAARPDAPLRRESSAGMEPPRPASTKVPPGGAYRVPQHGQLQIIIKNPNKTAVKLFLVPYDLDGMTAGTKTFVRQRSFSCGPVVDAASPDRPPGLGLRESPHGKDILRYLIHLKFCCTAKGRFYLYDTVRVVFANRVPDDKERLRNEVQRPEPRFSQYHPPHPRGTRSPAASEGAVSPRSNYTLSPDLPPFDPSHSSNLNHLDRLPASSSSPLPFHLSPGARADRDSSPEGPFEGPDAATSPEAERAVSPVAGFRPSTSSRGSPVPWLQSNGAAINRGFSPAPLEAGDGLLSRKLRALHGGPSDRRD